MPLCETWRSLYLNNTVALNQNSYRRKLFVQPKCNTKKYDLNSMRYHVCGIIQTMTTQKYDPGLLKDSEPKCAYTTCDMHFKEEFINLVMS